MGGEVNQFLSHEFGGLKRSMARVNLHIQNPVRQQISLTMNTKKNSINRKIDIYTYKM
jgi:hypothetical protein